MTPREIAENALNEARLSVAHNIGWLEKVLTEYGEQCREEEREKCADIAYQWLRTAVRDGDLTAESVCTMIYRDIMGEKKAADK